MIAAPLGPYLFDLALPGRTLGLGVDLVARGRVTDRLAQRHFTEEERATLSADLAFAVREAVIKAVGGVGIPGAPLVDMAARRIGSSLVFAPGPRYLPVLASKGVAEVVLVELPLADRSDLDVIGVLAIACGSGGAGRARTAVCLAHARPDDLAALTPEERSVVDGRHDPLPSIANRLAVRAAGRALGVRGELSVRGGGALRPTLAGAEIEGGLVSLGHERDFGVAAVLLPVR